MYILALARQRLGIPIGSEAAAERWSVSSVDVSRAAACPFLLVEPRSLRSTSGIMGTSWQPFILSLRTTFFAYNEQYLAAPTTAPILVERGGVLPPLEVDDVGGGPDNGTLVDDCFYVQSSMEGGSSWVA